jgi:hypothetical protein
MITWVAGLQPRPCCCLLKLCRVSSILCSDSRAPLCQKDCALSTVCWSSQGDGMFSLFHFGKSISSCIWLCHTQSPWKQELKSSTNIATHCLPSTTLCLLHHHPSSWGGVDPHPHAGTPLLSALQVPLPVSPAFRGHTAEMSFKPKQALPTTSAPKLLQAYKSHTPSVSSGRQWFCSTCIHPVPSTARSHQETKGLHKIAECCSHKMRAVLKIQALTEFPLSLSPRFVRDTGEDNEREASPRLAEWLFPSHRNRWCYLCFFLNFLQWRIYAVLASLELNKCMWVAAKCGGNTFMCIYSVYFDQYDTKSDFCVPTRPKSFTLLYKVDGRLIVQMNE